MANIAAWQAPESYSAANLADNTFLASRADGYYNVCQVGGADVVIDNETDKKLFMAVGSIWGSATWTTTGWFELYLLPAIDTAPAYASGSSSYLPVPGGRWGSMQLSTDTGAAARTPPPIIARIPPIKFKVLWRWKAGVTSASSGNGLAYRRFGVDLNGA